MNTKMKGSNIIECIPQAGKCPRNCDQCYFNRPDGTYARNNWQPIIPTALEAIGKIVRMNSGHDSNIDRALVLKTAAMYDDVFMNTSIPVGFIGFPWVLTLDVNENLEPHNIPYSMRQSLMFVRQRTVTDNLITVGANAREWTDLNIPFVLTFMAYYEQQKVPVFSCPAPQHPALHYTKGVLSPYEYRRRHDNYYWCLDGDVRSRILEDVCDLVSSDKRRMITMCGTTDSDLCVDCHNCETYYWQTRRRIKGY